MSMMADTEAWIYICIIQCSVNSDDYASARTDHIYNLTKRIYMYALYMNTNCVVVVNQWFELMKKKE